MSTQLRADNLISPQGGCVSVSHLPSKEALVCHVNQQHRQQKPGARCCRIGRVVWRLIIVPRRLRLPWYAVLA